MEKLEVKVPRRLANPHPLIETTRSAFELSRADWRGVRAPRGEGVLRVEVSDQARRLKGLEFSRVLLVGVQDGFVPLAVQGDPADVESRQQQELKERCLLYVAVTRARDELVIAGFGAPSPFLQ